MPVVRVLTTDMPGEDIERGKNPSITTKSNDGFPESLSKVSVAVGQEHLATVIPPHETYEGYHRFDITASWTPQEERRVVMKTDILLLTWICIMVLAHILWGAVKEEMLTD